MSNSCYIKRTIATVYGDSLSPLINNSEKVILLVNYYSCHKIKRNDIVAFKLKTAAYPFIKIIKGLPGDILKFNGSYAYINGKLLVNSQGKPYTFSKRSEIILSIPLIDHKIPNNMYLVLGDRINESLSFDSRAFGYVEKNQIIGKVEILSNQKSQAK